jgi:ABC-2 type transport system permease protein
MATLARQLIEHRELLWLLVVRNLKIRYKNSVLGFLWSLLGPLLLLGIYALFLGIMKFQISLPLLATGIFAWQYLSLCLNDSAAAVIGNANLVKKTAFPRIILPLSMVLANLINFLLSMLVVLAYLLARGEPMGSPLWFLPALAAHVAVCTGVSLLVAATNVFFRDVQQILGIVTLAWFFVTPVLYPPELVTDSFAGVLPQLFFANPMTGVLAGYRATLMGSALPSGPMLALSFGVGLALCVLGVAWFQRCQVRFADEL